MRLDRHLLRIDSTAALLAGAAMFALSSWLSDLYALPRALLLGMGAVNVAYGTFSGSLARRAERPQSLIVALVVANATWAAMCWVAAARLAGVASPFGMAHLIGEGTFVGGLAWAEWRARDLLASAPVPAR